MLFIYLLSDEQKYTSYKRNYVYANYFIKSKIHYFKLKIWNGIMIGLG